MLLTLYDLYGNEKAELQANDSSSQDKEVQADNVLSLGFTLYEHVAIDVNDYVDFGGERYWAVEKYEPAEKSSVEWEYSLKLYGIESLIKRFLVLNNTDGENEAVFTLTARPVDHVRLIVKCINDGMGTTDFKAGNVEGTDNIVINYAGKYCDEALKELAEAVGVEWWFEGETLNLSRCEWGSSVVLGYGEGLTSLEQDKADNVKFYTRLFPIGSSRNIDRERYGASRLQLPGGAKYVDMGDLVQKYGVIHHYEQEAFSGIYPRRVGVVSSVRSREVQDSDGKPYTIYYFKDNGLTFDPNAYEIGGLVKRVSFQEGSELAGLGTDNDHYFEVNYDSETREFEIITIWPYDDDRQLPGDTLVPKPGDKYILWNIRMPDEYYTLAETEFQSAVEEYNRKHTQDVSRYKAPTDHVWIEETGTELEVGRRVRLKSQEYFPRLGYRESRITRISRSVNLPSQMDLEISDALSSGTLDKIDDAISGAKSYAGSILGAVNVPDVIKSWDKTKPTDNNIYSARRTHKEFLGKNMADRAKKKIIFDEGIEAGDYKAGERGGYINGQGNAELQAMELRQHLIVGQSLTVGNDVDIAGTATIGGDASIGGNALVSRILTVLQGVKTRIVQSLNFSGHTMTDTGWQLTDSDETSRSRLTVDNLYVRWKAVFEELEVKKWSVTGGNQIWSSAANVIDRTDYLDSEGNYLGCSYESTTLGILKRIRTTLTAEQMTLVRRVRCYFLASDGENEVENWWRENDLVRCQSLNMTTAKRDPYTPESQKAGNVAWWRKCVGVSSEAVTVEGKQYHYFDVAVGSAADCLAGSDLPCAGDNAIQFGNTADPARMNAVSIEVTGSDAPSIKAYKGIYAFDLTRSWWGGKCEKMKLSPATGYEFYGPEFSMVTEYGTLPVTQQRGNWGDIVPERDDEGTHGSVRKCYYYDSVIYDGATWLCTITDGMHWRVAPVDGQTVTITFNGVTYNEGDKIPDSVYNDLNFPDSDKAKCEHVRNYTTDTPSAQSNAWTCMAQKGASITKVNETVRYVLSTDGKTPKSGQSWSSTKPTPAQDEYVLTKTVITWSDNSTTVLYNAERNPEDGQPGMSIVVDSQVTEYCRRTESQGQADPSTLVYSSTYPSQASEGDWIYSRTTVTYKTSGGASAGSTVSYGVSHVGKTGSQGVGVQSVTEHYLASTQSTGISTPSGQSPTDWDTNPMPNDWNDTKKYLWNYEKIVYTNGNVTRTTAGVAAIYTKGIDSITNYYKATSQNVGVVRPATDGTEGWSMSIQPIDGVNKYLWNYEKTTFTNGTSVYTDPHIMVTFADSAYIVQEDQSFLIRETAGGLSALPEGGGYIEAVKGNTVVWNQLQGTISNIIKVEKGVTFNISEDQTQIVAIVGDGGVTGNSSAYIPTNNNLTAGHKYIFRGCLKGGDNNTYYAQNAYYSDYGKDYGNGALFQADEPHLNFGFGVIIKVNTPVGTYIFTPQLFDLTIMFGAGNEPTTVEEFESWLADNVGLQDYYDYDAGSLIPVRMNGIKTIGFNQWDEEWELGNINGNTGANQDSSNRIRSKNYIKVICGANYYFRGPINTNIRIVYYDESKNVISAIDSNDSEFTTPNNAFYIRFVYGSGAAPYTSYNHDICINLSNDSLNGIYKPYSENRAALPITSLTGRLNGTGSSVTVFPDGLKKVGDVYDEIKVENGVVKAVKRVGSVDLGTIAWLNGNNEGVTYTNGTFTTFGLPSIKNATSNIACNVYEEIPSTGYNALSESSYEKAIACYGYDNRPILKDSALIGKSQSQVRTYLSGTIFYYELATPEEYIIDDIPLPAPYKVEQGGTEEVTTANDVLTAKPTMKLLYGASAEYMKAKADNVKDGDDALVLTLSPTTAVFSQAETEPYAIIIPSGGFIINILASLGTADVTSSVTIGTPVSSKITVSGIEQAVCTCTVDNTNKLVKITAIRNDATQGTVTIPVTYNGVTRNLVFPLYCNLLGTWKQSVVNGVETVVANKVTYSFINGVLTKDNRDFDSIRSAAIANETWKAQKESQYNGYSTSINNLTNRVTTAEGTLTTVRKEVESEQLLPWDGWSAMGIMDKQESTYYISVYYDEDRDEYPSLNTPVVDLPAGDYCFFYYTDHWDSYDYTYNHEVSFEGEVISHTYTRSTASDWNGYDKHVIKFTLTSRGKVSINIEEVDYNDLDIYRPMLNSGNSPKAFNPNLKLATESSVSQTADAINLSIRNGLEETGINIGTKKIVAKTNNFEIRNSSNQKTFGIDADGNLEARGNATFKGAVKAKRYYDPYLFIDASGVGSTVTITDPSSTIFVKNSIKTLTIMLPDPDDHDGLEITILGTAFSGGNYGITMIDCVASETWAHPDTGVGWAFRSLSNMVVRVGNSDVTLGIDVFTLEIPSKSSVDGGNAINKSIIHAGPSVIKLKSIRETAHLANHNQWLIMEASNVIISKSTYEVAV